GRPLPRARVERAPGPLAGGAARDPRLLQAHQRGEAVRGLRAAPVPSGREGGFRWWAALLVAPILLAAPARAQEATSVDSLVMRAMDLEVGGKYREAAPLFRRALRSPDPANAMLGLERVYAELGWQDSLFAPLDSLIAARPREAVYRTIRLRTLEGLGR